LTNDATSVPPREIELKLALERDAMPALMRHAAVVASKSGRARTSRLVSAYYDTAGGALASAGVALRIRRDGKRFVQTVKGPPEDGSDAALSSRAEYEWPLRRPAIDATVLRATPWSGLLRRALDDGLVNRFTTDVTRRELPLALSGGTRARLCVDSGEIRAPGVRQRVPIAEIEIELVDGEPTRMYELARALAHDLPVALLPASKAERGFALATGAQGRASPVRARNVALAAQARAVEALATIARECLHHVAANATGVAADRDPEWVHQMRVGTRRLRACLKLASRVDASIPVAPVAAELKWLAGVLGTARDLDVFATQTLPQVTSALHGDRRASAALGQLARRIARRRGIARRAVRTAVTSARYTQCMLATGALIACLDAAPSAQPAADAASALLARRHRRLHRRAAALADGSAQQRHAARIAAKKLRYAAEFFAPLHSRKHARRYLRALIELQHVLGAGNDWVSATHLAVESGPELGAATVRAFAAAQSSGQAPALRKAWKRFERAEPFWDEA